MKSDQSYCLFLPYIESFGWHKLAYYNAVGRDPIERLRFLAPGAREGGEKMQLFKCFPSHRVMGFSRTSWLRNLHLWVVLDKCTGSLLRSVYLWIKGSVKSRAFLLRHRTCFPSLCLTRLTETFIQKYLRLSTYKSLITEYPQFFQGNLRNELTTLSVTKHPKKNSPTAAPCIHLLALYRATAADSGFFRDWV